MEPVIRTRIREAYFLIRRLDIGVNPVRKVQLNIYRVADQVCIDELANAIDDGSDGAGGGEVHGGPRNGATDSSEQLQTLKLQLSSMQHALEASLGGFRSVVGEQFSVVNCNINRVAAQPAFQRGRLNVGLNGGGLIHCWLRSCPPIPNLWPTSGQSIFMGLGVKRWLKTSHSVNEAAGSLNTADGKQ